MKISTWNVNSVNARLEVILKWFEAEQPDVCSLQELKCIDEKFPYAAFESLGYNACVHGQKTYNGVAILSKYPLIDITKGLKGEDEQSRYLEAVIDAPSPFRVTSIYLPNGNPMGTEKYAYKLRWIDRLYARATELLTLEERTILSGDFNIIPEPVDCYNPAVWLEDALFQPQVRAAFRSFKNLGYVDAFDVLTPVDNRYTFWDYQAGAWQKNEGIRIDHHLMSPQAADTLSGFTIHKATRGIATDTAKASDHVPVSVEFGSVEFSV